MGSSFEWFVVDIVLEGNHAPCGAETAIDLQIMFWKFEFYSTRKGAVFTILHFHFFF
jgi:hypothetical protein